MGITIKITTRKEHLKSQNKYQYYANAIAGNMLLLVKSTFEDIPIRTVQNRSLLHSYVHVENAD